MQNLNRDDIKFIVKRILRDYPMSGRDSAAKRIADELSERMNMNKAWNAYHGFPENLEPVVRRLEKGLALNLLKRTPEAAKVYEWVVEEEKQGRSLEKFCEWALKPERINYVGKYRAKPENIMADYPQAFLERKSSVEVEKDEKGVTMSW